MHPLLVAKVIGHESMTMINEVYAHLETSDAHDALMKSLLPQELER
jgi:hypothetical protein